MKPIVLICSCFLLFIGLCSFRAVPEPGRADVLTLSVENNGWKLINGKKLLGIRASLRNNTTDTLYFVNMSCSFIDAFTTDNNDLVFDFAGCDKNVPETHTIMPGSEYSYDLLIKCKKAQPPSSFKIGFYWVKQKNVLLTPSFKDAANKLIWSNLITI